MGLSVTIPIVPIFVVFTIFAYITWCKKDKYRFRDTLPDTVTLTTLTNSSVAGTSRSGIATTTFNSSAHSNPTRASAPPPSAPPRPAQESPREPPPPYPADSFPLAQVCIAVRCIARYHIFTRSFDAFIELKFLENQKLVWFLPSRILCTEGGIVEDRRIFFMLTHTIIIEV